MVCLPQEYYFQNASSLRFILPSQKWVIFLSKSCFPCRKITFLEFLPLDQIYTSVSFSKETSCLLLIYFLLWSYSIDRNYLLHKFNIYNVFFSVETNYLFLEKNIKKLKIYYFNPLCYGLF